MFHDASASTLIWLQLWLITDTSFKTSDRRRHFSSAGIWTPFGSEESTIWISGCWEAFCMTRDAARSSGFMSDSTAVCERRSWTLHWRQYRWSGWRRCWRSRATSPRKSGLGRCHRTGKTLWWHGQRRRASSRPERHLRHREKDHHVSVTALLTTWGHLVNVWWVIMNGDGPACLPIPRCLSRGSGDRLHCVLFLIHTVCILQFYQIN